MAEADGIRTHHGPTGPSTGFEDQGHHQTPPASGATIVGDGSLARLDEGKPGERPAQERSSSGSVESQPKWWTAQRPARMASAAS